MSIPHEMKGWIAEVIGRPPLNLLESFLAIIIVSYTRALGWTARDVNIAGDHQLISQK